MVQGDEPMIEKEMINKSAIPFSKMMILSDKFNI